MLRSVDFADALISGAVMREFHHSSLDGRVENSSFGNVASRTHVGWKYYRFPFTFDEFHAFKDWKPFYSTQKSVLSLFLEEQE